MNGSGGAPPALRPGRAGRPARLLGGLLAMGAVIGVGVAAYVMAGGAGGAADDTVAVVRPGERGPSDRATAAEGAVEVAVGVGDQQLEFLLPEGWVDSAPGSGATGDILFPDNPALALAFETNLQSAIQRGAILFALDTNLETEAQLLVQFSEIAPRDTFAELLTERRQIILGSTDVNMEADTTIPVADADGHLFRYEVTGRARPVAFMQVVIPSDDALFVLVAQSIDKATIDELVTLISTVRIN